MQNDFQARILVWIEWACRLGLAGLFFYAALPKMADPDAFAKAIANYKVILPIIGQGYVYPAAMFVPALEAIIGVGILLNRSKRAASWLSAGILALFTVLILQAVLRGLNIDCGCFGASELAQSKATKVGWIKIAQNTGWMMASIFVYSRSRPKRSRYRL
jgi:uncharacterized membrane protein YphA (DoxX/SURF4 family)